MDISLNCSVCGRLTSEDYRDSEGHLWLSVKVSGFDRVTFHDRDIYRYTCSSPESCKKALEDALRELNEYAREHVSRMERWFPAKSSEVD